MSSQIEYKINAYPSVVQEKFYELRTLILDLAEANDLEPVEECLKWGEPAFLSKYGSTIRVDWKSKFPGHIFLFFNCKTVLVETFREIFPDTFNFHGNRSIGLDVRKQLPEELEICLLMALNYHKLKKLPLLGA